MRAIGRAVINGLSGDNGLRFFYKRHIIRACIQISQKVWIIAARYINADTISLGKYIASDPPEIYRILVDLVRLDRAKLLRIEGAAIFRVAIARPHHPLSDDGRIAVRMHIDQMHNPVGVLRRGRSK